MFAFVGVDEEFQIEQFITINREAKGVPTSLVYDLLSHLPNRKKPGDIATERAAEIANELRHDPKSALYNRIVVTQSPTKGKISITNFVRKIQPHVHPERGVLRVKEAANSPLSAFRNATLYDSVAWHWPVDLASPRMPPANRIARIAAEDEFQSMSLKALAAIFEFVTWNVTELASALSYDPSRLSRIFDKPGTPVGLLT